MSPCRHRAARRLSYSDRRFKIASRFRNPRASVWLPKRRLALRLARITDSIRMETGKRLALRSAARRFKLEYRLRGRGGSEAPLVLLKLGLHGIRCADAVNRGGNARIGNVPRIRPLRYSLLRGSTVTPRATSAPRPIA
jgi:hypothetical protein